MISLPTCEVFNRPVSFKTQQGGVRLQWASVASCWGGWWTFEIQSGNIWEPEMKRWRMRRAVTWGTLKCASNGQRRKKLKFPGIQPSEMQNISDGKEGLGPSYRACNAPGFPPVQLPSLRVPQSIGSSWGIYSAHYFFRFSQFMKGQSHRQEWCSAHTQQHPHPLLWVSRLHNYTSGC